MLKKILAAGVVLYALSFPAGNAYIDVPGNAAPEISGQAAGLLVESPDNEVKEAIHMYTGKTHEEDGKENGKNFLRRLRIRINFYKESHRWDDRSYAYTVLHTMYKDYEEYFRNGPEEGETEEQAMLEIAEKTAAPVDSSEIRTYVNEALIFATKGKN